MSKGAYYAGMATAPQVKPADFYTPFANMADRISQREIEKENKSKLNKRLTKSLL